MSLRPPRIVPSPRLAKNLRRRCWSPRPWLLNPRPRTPSKQKPPMTGRAAAETARPEPVTAKRFAATVSYDGSEFAGSQVQPNARTVQGGLETAAQALFGSPTRIELAGRTDAGVHARGQVAAFSAETRLEA